MGLPPLHPYPVRSLITSPFVTALKLSGQLRRKKQFSWYVFFRVRVHYYKKSMTAAIESLLSEEKAIHTAEKERENALFLNLLVATAPAIPKLIAAVLSGSITLWQWRCR
ncbi:hypothetical protein, partial [Methanocalculus chunghsingensis]|uniref:hypothetical protein n=1 Tax=Methanocalculus chunghsingensis TaxID=156457 RepID=UPI001B8BF907